MSVLFADYKKAEQEAAAKHQAEEEAKKKAKEEARRKAEEEARKKAEAEAKKKAEEEAKRKAAEEARKKAEEEARRKAEEEARRKAEEEARRKAEEEAKRKAEEEARRKAEEEARKKAEEEARKKAEEEARKKAEERAKKREEIERLFIKAEKEEDKNELESTIEAYLKVLEKAEAFEDDEILKKAYRRLARAGYKLNVYYTERSAGFYIDAMLAADNGDIKNEDALREQGDEFAKKAKQAMLASQRYDKRSRQVK